MEFYSFVSSVFIISFVHFFSCSFIRASISIYELFPIFPHYTSHYSKYSELFTRMEIRILGIASA